MDPIPSDSVIIAAALKSATSIFEILFPVASTSKVLFVNVKVSDAMLASCVSTYALIDCCVASAVALLVPIASSSKIVVTVDPLVPTFKFSKTTVPEPLAFINRSSFDLFVLIALSEIVKSLRTMFPVPAVVIVKSAFEGAVKVDPIEPMSPKSSSVPNSRAFPAAFTLRTCSDEPIDERPVPPNAVPTVSPDWNSAKPVATLDSLKTTRTGVLSAIN